MRAQSESGMTRDGIPLQENGSPAVETPAKISYQTLIVSYTGEIGRWQCFMIFTVMVPKMLLCWSLVSVSFTFGKTDWWKETTVINPKSMVCIKT